MEKTFHSLQKVETVLASFEKAINKAKLEKNSDDFEFFHDSVVQRFEYSIESVWKLMKIVLREVESLECFSPKDCVKQMFKLGYIDNIEGWLEMLNARNVTSHLCGEEYAEDIYENS